MFSLIQTTSDSRSDVEVADTKEEQMLFSTIDSFIRYSSVAHFTITHRRRQAFYALPEKHWKLLSSKVNYLETLDAVDDAIDSNGELARSIAQCALQASLKSQDLPPKWVGCATHNDIDKARSSIRQFFRDWTVDGEKERELCYGPVKEALLKEAMNRLNNIKDDYPSFQHTSAPDRLNILVPGAGLGRLVFDLCLLGFVVEGNEISYHQLLASNYILNNCPEANHHTIHPWINSFSNHRSRFNHLRGYSVPDIHPASAVASSMDVQLEVDEGGTQGPILTGNASQTASGDRYPSPYGLPGSMTMCAADFICLYGDDEHRERYDAVASVFFLDTAPNLIRYLETIYSCLSPGGILINFGPLLWHFENYSPHRDDNNVDEAMIEGGSYSKRQSEGIADPGGFELTDDEVLLLLKEIGFSLEDYKPGLRAPYIQDDLSMLQTEYKASFWIARKPI